MTAGKLAFKSVIRAIDSNWTKKKRRKRALHNYFKYLQVSSSVHVGMVLWEDSTGHNLHWAAHISIVAIWTKQNETKRNKATNLKIRSIG